MPQPSTPAQVEQFVEANGSLIEPVWLDDEGRQVQRAAATMVRLRKRVIGKGTTGIHVDVGDLPNLATHLALPRDLVA